MSISSFTDVQYMYVNPKSIACKDAIPFSYGPNFHIHALNDNEGCIKRDSDKACYDTLQVVAI